MPRALKVQKKRNQRVAIRPELVRELNQELRDRGRVKPNPTSNAGEFALDRRKNKKGREGMKCKTGTDQYLE